MPADDFLGIGVESKEAPEKSEESKALGEPRQDSYEILVFDCNWEAAHVFDACLLIETMGMAGPHAVGIASTEIESVMRIMEIPHSRKLHILQSVRYMSTVAASWQNRRTAERAAKSTRQK